MPNLTTKSCQKLTDFLALIKDPRRRQGRRYSLVQILVILIYGSACGCSCVSECQQKAKSNLGFFKATLGLAKIPDSTTIIRAIARVPALSVITSSDRFIQLVAGFASEQTLSIDGKTLRAVHGSYPNHTPVRHILSLFAGAGKRTFYQLGINDKSSEIIACKKLLETNQDVIMGKIITGDAIFTQRTICQKIVDSYGDYLFRLKDNQEQLKLEVSELFELSLIKTQVFNHHSSTHGRREIIQVEVSSDLTIFHDNLTLNHLPGWKHVNTIGKITTFSQRSKCLDGYTGKTTFRPGQSTTYFLSSISNLKAKKAYHLIKSHWGIENYLHRHKDMIFNEDRQTLRTGYAQEILTFIRSFCIYLLYQVSPHNLAYGFRQFNYHPKLVQNYFRKANLI